MNRYLGRVTGAILGSLAGVPGLLFGVLAGWLVDQYVAAAPGDARLDRFLKRPDLERGSVRTRLFSMASLAAAVLGADGPPLPERVEMAIAAEWPGGDTVTRGAAVRRRVLERALGSLEQIDAVLIAEHANGWFGPRQEDVDRFLLALTDAALPPDYAATPGLCREMRRIGTALKASPAARERVEDRLRKLDAYNCRVLGVDRNADRDEVRRAYRRLAVDLHPDTAGNLDQRQQGELREAFVRVHSAYDALTAQLDAREGTSVPENAVPENSNGPSVPRNTP